MSDALWNAAFALREAQRAYMDDRGNDAKGKAVAEAAKKLDEALEDSALSELSTPPAGEWALVPREPTPEMMAAANALPDYFDPGDEWRAMLAAAPEPATQEVG